jgi:hypothetical protein
MRDDRIYTLTQNGNILSLSLSKRHRVGITRERVPGDSWRSYLYILNHLLDLGNIGAHRGEFREQRVQWRHSWFEFRGFKDSGMYTIQIFLRIRWIPIHYRYNLVHHRYISALYTLYNQYIYTSIYLYILIISYIDPSSLFSHHGGRV